MTYLIVIESEGAGSAFHHQPYRLASSIDEAKELMRDYMRVGPDSDALVPQYFVLYRERDGEFGIGTYYDPCSTDLNEIDPTEWLQATGRI